MRGALAGLLCGACARRAGAPAARFAAVRRSASAIGGPQRFARTEPKWRDVDGLGAEWELVYRSTLGKYAYTTIGVCAFVTCGTVAFVAHRLFFADEFAPALNTTEETMVLFDGTATQLAGLIAAGLAIAAFSYSHAVRTVLRAYRRGDEFVALMPDPIVPWALRRVRFARGDAVKQRWSNLVGSPQVRYKLGGVRASLVGGNFKTPKHMYDMLGGAHDEQEDDDD